MRLLSTILMFCVLFSHVAWAGDDRSRIRESSKPFMAQLTAEGGTAKSFNHCAGVFWVRSAEHREPDLHWVYLKLRGETMRLLRKEGLTEHEANLRLTKFVFWIDKISASDPAAFIIWIDPCLVLFNEWTAGSHLWNGG